MACSGYMEADFEGIVCIVQVRLWKTARTQEEILSNMRKASGLENHSDLIAYWKFNDPDQCVLCIQSNMQPAQPSMQPAMKQDRLLQRFHSK